MEKYVCGSLDTIFYIPDFLTVEEQDSLVRQVKSAPLAKWKSLKNRRLQNWVPSWLKPLTEKIESETGLFPSPINHILVNEYEPGQGIMPHQDGPLYFPVVAIVSLGSPTVMRFSPHSKIVNLEEGNEYKRKEKLLDVREDFTDKEAPEHAKEERNLKDVSLILLRGSLLLFKDSAYKDYLHGIDECSEHALDDTVLNPDVIKVLGAENEASDVPDPGHMSEAQILRRTGTRISLTCRCVPKVVLSNILRL
ncbi:hypothetical protein AXG93_1976s1520 [Marchantia polymorpha subsp. ruderalis]|uniref:Fe2OG dioxygenase domain-containing protein n=1 Tax=Marchantia polymorpha subsp. ruderalis TaxID=1480154 RepID=A0A176VGB0_MARPO|nr:hypothetical protein AXG93_1976s1520 [Marchantia polymorpha subsp. ruderalis]